MILEQIDASAVYGHGRRIGKRDAVLYVQRENLVLRRRFPRVRLENHRDWRDAGAGGIDRAAAELEDERGTGDVERVRGATEWVVRQSRCSHHPIKHARRLDLSLEGGAANRGNMVGGAERVEHPDDRVAAEIRGVAHRRAPVAVGDARVLVHEFRML